MQYVVNEIEVPAGAVATVNWAERGMAEVQDDDQWLYGDDKDDGKEEEGELTEKADESEKTVEVRLADQ